MCPVELKESEMTALVMGLPGGMEWVILLVVALLLFGGQRIAGMGKGAGRAIREFKEEIQAPTGVDTPKADKAADASTTADPPKAVEVAQTSEPVDAEIVPSESSTQS
jgi:sec-independent protein translocase protein TatA